MSNVTITIEYGDDEDTGDVIAAKLQALAGKTVNLESEDSGIMLSLIDKWERNEGSLSVSVNSLLIKHGFVDLLVANSANK